MTDNIIIQIDDQQIECAAPVEVADTSKQTVKFYMRRKSTYFFKAVTGKIRVEMADVPAELKNLKYGDILEAAWG